MATAIIMAGGSGKDWTDPPRHLLEVDGETLLERTTRLFQGFDVHINAADDDRYRIPGATHHTQQSDPSWGQQAKFFSTRHLWNTEDRTVLLYGDVYYTDAAADIIATNRDDFTMYARRGQSQYTGCRHGELFGFSFHPKHHNDIVNALWTTLEWVETNRHSRAIGWEMHRAYLGLPAKPHTIPIDKVVEINDWTEDFDTESDWNMWNNNRTVALSKRG